MPRSRLCTRSSNCIRTRYSVECFDGLHVAIAVSATIVAVLRLLDIALYEEILGIHRR